MYYYFYERTREAILRSKAGSKALSTPESMLAGLIAGKHLFLCVISSEAEHKPRLWSSGSATTVISNPIWVVQTSQAVRTMGGNSSEGTIVKKLGFFETLKNLLAKEGPGYV